MSNTGSLVKPPQVNSIDPPARNQQIQRGKMVPRSFDPVTSNRWEMLIDLDRANWRSELFTEILSSQNLASCRIIFNGFIKNISIISASASGFMNGGMLKLELYRKLNMLSVQITPKIPANSMRCCSDKWFLGSNSKISTWFTPDERHP